MTDPKLLRYGLQDWPKETQDKADELFWPHRAAISRTQGYYDLLLAQKLEYPADIETARDIAEHRVMAELEVLTEKEIEAYAFLVATVTENVTGMLDAVHQQYPDRMGDPIGSKLEAGLQEHLVEMRKHGESYPDQMGRRLAAARRILLRAVEETERGAGTLNLLRWSEGFAHYTNTNSALGAISMGEPMPGSEDARRGKTNSVAAALTAAIREVLTP
jgi:hypothetical protein